MKKNNKGFTLIELLAALVILGLLVMLGLPRLVDAITTSKDKVYVSDAKRLIAQTEYKVKVNSSVVEMPDKYYCDVIGLKYLDASDFDSPPNDGEYLEEQSFVVIRKNEAGNYEYSARLVEEYKDGKGYKGIKLSRDNALDYKGGLSCIKAFTEDEVADDVVSMSENELKNFINDKLGENYCAGISNIYRELDLDDSSAGQSNSSPKITSATLTSNGSEKNFNSFKAQFRLRADDDGGRENLKVCFSTIGYDSAAETCENYIDHSNENGVFIYDFDFSEGRSYIENNDPITLYFMVKDQAGGYSRRQLTYEFHKNEAPVIDKETTTIVSKSEDSFNGFNTIITLNVSDDITEVSNLDVCLDENSTGRCEYDYNYKKYTEYFGVGNRLDYTIDATDLDGSTHVIEVHVKDEFGVEADPYVLVYTLYNSPTPGFNGGDGSLVTLSPVLYKNIMEGSLKVDVSFTLLDELGAVPNNQIGVRIAQIKADKSTFNVKDYNYLDSNGRVNKKFSYLIKDEETNQPLYKGQLVKLKVSVYKKPYGSSIENYEIVNYQVHKNSAPKVYFTGIYPTGFDACVQGYRCDAYSRHSTEVLYTYKVEEDIDTGSDLLYCVSENYNDCLNQSNFKHFPSGWYDDFTTFEPTEQYNFTPSNSLLPYQNNALKDLYVFVRDSYGQVSNTHIEGGYELYTNKPPFIDILEVIDAGEQGISSGSKNIKLSPRLYNNDYLMFDMHDHGGSTYVADDMTDNKYLAYKITINGFPLYDGEGFDAKPLELTLEDIERLKNSNDPHAWDDVLTFDKMLNQELDVHLGENSYDGTTLHFELILTDSYGESSSFTADYQLYNNKPPTIDRFDLVSSTPACQDCTDGGYTVGVRVSVSDDLTSNDDLLVCVGESVDWCTDDLFVPYSKYFEDKEYSYTFEGANNLIAYLGQTKKLYLVAKDSVGTKSYAELEYTVYENRAPNIDDEVSITSQNENFVSSESIFNSTATDDLGNLYERICYADLTSEGNSDSSYYCTDYAPYDEHFKFKFNTYAYNGQIYNVYAEVMDDYGLKDVSPTIEYQIGIDNTPSITSVGGKYGVPGRNGKGVVTFKGTDYGDYYNVCVTTSNNSNGCNYSSDYFDGSSDEEFTYIYNFGSNPQNTTTTYYFFAKDQSGKVSSAKSFKFGQYSDSVSACETSDDFRRVTYSGRSGKYMNADTCSGRCYYWPEERDANNVVIKEASDTVGISVPYVKDISYFDKFDVNKRCGQFTSYVSLNCSSVECFNTGTSTDKNYSGNKVIGLEEHIAAEDWMYYDENRVYHNIPAGTRYYYVYITSYNEGDEYITLNPTSYIVEEEFINDYKYVVGGSNNYLRALDSDDIKLSKPTSDKVKSKVKLVERQNYGTITMGDRVEIGSYSYHVISSNPTETVLLQDYNVLYGLYFYNELDIYSAPYWSVTSSQYCRQNSDAIGWSQDSLIRKGVIYFSNSHFWDDGSGLKPQYAKDLYGNPASYGGSRVPYVYDEYWIYGCNADLKNDFDADNIIVNDIRFMSYEEAKSIGCTSADDSCPPWASTGTYWLGSAAGSDSVYTVKSDGSLVVADYVNSYVGYRYVITINTNEINTN